MAKKLLMGNEAFAHAALEAGVRVAAGYPGTPSSEVIETIAKLHAAGIARGVHVEWSTNEKVALELLAGASYAGARCLFTCKQVGLNVASDPLMSLNYVGVKGGLVLFVADDPGPISSQTEQDTRRFASFAKLPVLDPSTLEEGFAMMKAAFDLSERYGTPVIVRPTTRVCHASTFFEVADTTDARPIPDEGFVRDSKWVIFPRRAWEAHGEINERLVRIACDFSEDSVFAAFNPIVEPLEKAGVSDVSRETSVDGEAIRQEGGCRTDAVEKSAFETSANENADEKDMCGASAGEKVASGVRVGILTGGVTAAYAREALRMLEKRAAAAGAEISPYRFMQVGTPYPFPEDAVARFAKGLDRVLVLEELDHVLEDGLLVLAGKGHASCEVLGRLTGDARDRGENDVDDIAQRIARFFSASGLVASFNANVSRETSSQVSLEAVSKTPFEMLSETSSEIPSKASSGPASKASLAASSAFASSIASAPAPLVFDEPLPVRPPVLCAGCPHRGSFYAVKRALGKTPAVLCGDIGCYTLGNAKPLDAVDTCLCMGAGITMAQGFAVAEPEKKHVAFVGDSTFFASGLTGIVNAVYNGHDITVCVLDNATTAMTGSQPHPGTGVTLMGLRRAPVSIERVLEAVGFTCIVHADPLDRAAAEEAAREALAFEGPSAILFESPCVQLVRPGMPARVDAGRCTGCKKCITEIGCPGIGFDADARGSKSKERGQAFVDASLCNGCGLCVQVCPFDALEIPSATPSVSRETSSGADGVATVSRETVVCAAEASDVSRETSDSEKGVAVVEGSTGAAHPIDAADAAHAVDAVHSTDAAQATGAAAASGLADESRSEGGLRA